VCLGLLLITPACGGGSASLAGGGTSGTGISGGTSGTGISGGSINSFGSVVVNGTTYLTSTDDDDIDTAFVGPGAGFAEADLAPGMLVQVDWQNADDSAVREALQITYLPELSGPLTALPLLLFAAAARRLKLATLGLVQYLAPTISLLLGVWVFHEPFDGRRLVGFAFIWSALAIVSADALGLRRLRPAPAPPP